MTKRRVSVRENKLIWEICRLLPSHILLISDEERLDLLIDLDEAEREMLLKLCSRIITTAVDGKNIKTAQLKKRYANQLN